MTPRCTWIQIVHPVANSPGWTDRKTSQFPTPPSSSQIPDFALSRLGLKPQRYRRYVRISHHQRHLSVLRPKRMGNSCQTLTRSTPWSC
ncbi:hypothetical protein BO71DRAFT_82997 [Aspergillus ellipticus CBS 707.79]|uniref:Uncharacterized protein n=1 Tax=Aspergillus ellipticus CBS 707.79 TaxID=1448320 RepID=A0A319CZQ4_9EURO|nr:hypothetical protein BO71DRAFT_82997 [Aspergillus ellipticus CBS 707.79]